MMILNTNYNEYSIPQSAAKTAAKNHLPSVRSSLKSAFPDEIPSTYEAVIAAVDLRSASAFTVSLAAGVKIAAVLVAGEYVAKYEGSISEMVFSGSTTLTQLLVKWYRGKKNSFATKIATLPAGGTISAVKDSSGRTLSISLDDTYDLHKGIVYISATLENYVSLVDVPFAVDGSGYIWAPLNPTAFAITFAVTPQGASIVVKNASGFAMIPNADGTYTLPNSTIAGNYSYTISKAGYLDSTGTLTVSAAATETVSLTAKLTSIAVTTAPAKTSYHVGDLFDNTGMVVTASYTGGTTSAATGYAWSPVIALTKEDTEIIIIYTKDGITKTTTQAITVA